MKQEQFKRMYRQIHLEKVQKDRIWQCLEETRERNARKISRLPARVAVCAGVLLVSGMTVFAASEFSLMDRLTEAMDLLTQNKQELTEEQKNIYAQYGTALDNEVVRANGTFKLEAALYDENCLFIPFRYIVNPDSEGYEKIVAGFDFDKSKMWQSKLLTGYWQDLDDLWYGVSQGSKQARGISGSMSVINPKVEEDGVLTGSLLLSVEEGKTFGQGDVIQVVRKAEQPEDDTIPDEILTEFTLGNAVEQHSISIDAAQAEALEQMGLSIEQVSVSSISLHISGRCRNDAQIPYSWSVVLRDGSTVNESASGGSSGIPERMEESHSFYAVRLFAAPVQIEEIAGIRIRNRTLEVWIAAD